jgi:hypothetical protein
MPHARETHLTTLLLGHTDGPAAAAGRLGVLATHTEAPVVTETTVGADLLQALKVITELGVDTVGEDLRVLAIDNVTLPVEEPRGDLVGGGVLDNGDQALKLFRGELTGALVQVDIGLLAHKVGCSPGQPCIPPNVRFRWSERLFANRRDAELTGYVQ